MLSSAVRNDSCLHYAHRVEVEAANVVDESLLAKKIVRGLASAAAAVSAVGAPKEGKRAQRLLRATFVLTAEPARFEKTSAPSRATTPVRRKRRNHA
jgi:hypothetical protein